MSPKETSPPPISSKEPPVDGAGNKEERVILQRCKIGPSSNDARAALRVHLREHAGRFDFKAARLSRYIDRTVVSHPYARGPDLANDELGYGENVAVPVASVRGGALASGTVLEVRTKTGTIIVPDDED